MSKHKTPTATKAPAERTDAAGKQTEQPVTKLADVQDPASLTKADIQEISGDDGTDDRENSANQDVAEGLHEAKAEAKASEDGDERGYYHGHGGGVGGPG